MLDILRLLGIIYMALGAAIVLAAVMMIISNPSKLTITMGDQHIHGWRRGFITLFLLVVVFFAWPLVVYQAAKD